MPRPSATGPPLVATTFTVRRWTAQDWPAVRAIRLRMLADAPIAFLETHEHALSLPDAEWQARARRGSAGSTGTSTSFAAVAPDGAWLGTMGAYLDRPGSAVLVSVYVEPAARGRTAGVTQALLEAVHDWARAAGATRLTLLVHERNARAAGFYRRVGYVATGHREPYPLDPTTEQVEMALQLAPAPR